MEKFVINGPCNLNGEITVRGSKNAALPIIAATVLTPGNFVIHNVPHITDIENMLKLLNGMGAKTEFEKNTVKIDTTDLNSFTPDEKLVRNIRASILFLGPLLARFKEVKIALPGGCFIGARPVDTHLETLVALGARVISQNSHYHLKTEKLIGNKLILREFSVTGTESAVMAAVLAEGKTELRLAATEPHVVDLCNFLCKMGAKISGIGTHDLQIEGVKSLKPCEYTLIPDQIEAGTFAIAAAASRGELTIEGFVFDHHDSLIEKFKEMKINFEKLSNTKIKILPTHSFNPIKLRTNIHPGFPTDLQAPMGVLMTQANGTSYIHETVFEGRLNYLNELNKMGADCVIKSQHEATVSGPTPLFGTTITSFDLRAGATLIIASFIAKGESVIEQAEIIDRGYEKIDKRLNSIGANIQRVSS